MRNRLLWRHGWRIVHAAVTLGLVAVCALLWFRPKESKDELPQSSEPTRRDSALRSLMGVSSIGGDYILPDDGAEWYMLTTLRYIDGVWAGKESMHGSRISSEADRLLDCQFSWVEVNGEPHTSVNGTTEYGSVEKAAFFRELTGVKKTHVKPSSDVLGEYQGMSIVAMAYSRKARDGRELPQHTPEDPRTPEEAVRLRKYVLLVGVKTFPDHSAAELWAQEHLGW